jgi:hypothetical protein
MTRPLTFVAPTSASSSHRSIGRRQPRLALHHRVEILFDALADQVSQSVISPCRSR